MSAAYYIVLDTQDPGFDPFVNGKALARASDALQDAAAQLGVRPLMDFFSMSADSVEEAAAEFGLDEETLSAAPAEAWFEPADGLRTVRALLQHCEQVREQLPGHEVVREELLEYARVLEQAQSRGFRWHLAVDY